MKKEKVTKVKINGLYKIAEEYRKNMTDETEIEQEDMTDNFWYELEQMVKGKEIIIMNINAKMRLGKSTLAMKIGKEIFEMLKQHGFRKPNEEFGMKNIARDQQEHSKKMRDPETEFTVIVTDESNELENTGENVTAEKALSRVFSDVQAGRYVHRVCCSPKETVDSNADIMLSVIGIDRKKSLTHAKLYYRYYEGGHEQIILLGYVRISVEDVIRTWKKESEELFFKKNKTEEEEKRMKTLAREDWYTEYMIKKYEKMELLVKEGIFKPRVLEYAEMIMTTVKKLKTLTKASNIINPNIIRNYLKIEMRNAKIPMSIVGEELATREAQGLLDLYKSYHKLNKQINKIKEERDKKKGAMENGEADKIIEDAEFGENIQQLEDMRNELANAIKVQEEEYQRYAEINKRYNTLTSEKKEGKE